MHSCLFPLLTGASQEGTGEQVYVGTRQLGWLVLILTPEL